MDPVTMQAAFLIDSGVPFDTAFQLAEMGVYGDPMGLALQVLFGRIKSGQEFDWDTMSFIPNDPA